MSINPTNASLNIRSMWKAFRRFKNQPLKQLASRAMRWALNRCPRVQIYLDQNRLLFTRLLPDRAKDYLKTISRGAKTNPLLLKQLDEFISREGIENPSNRLCLIFSGTTFTDSEGQRPTRLARELAHRGIPVIFAYWRWETSAPVQKSTFPGIFCLPIDELQKTYTSLFSDPRLSSLKRIFLMEFPHSSLLEIINYANVHGWRTVYEVIDDWEEFQKQGQAGWYDRDLETYLLNNADAATITCETMRNKIVERDSPFFAETKIGTVPLTTALSENGTVPFGNCFITPHLLPNAFEDWTNSNLQDPLSVRKGRITIGYFGHLTASWFDWQLLTSVAKRRKDWIFHIIGYGLDKRIRTPGNVLFLGKVDHCDLPAYAKLWDVAMIPFQATDLARAVDPIKIYEYISLHLPTVVTGMPHLATYPGVSAVENDLEFEAAVEEAAKNRLDPATVENFVNQNRWSNRIDALLNILDDETHHSAAALAFTENKPYLIRVAA